MCLYVFQVSVNFSFQSMDTDVSYVTERDMGATASADPANQREVQVQVISHSVLQEKTVGPEEDLFMNRQNLRPKNHFEDEFEVSLVSVVGTRVLHGMNVSSRAG